MTRGRDWKVIWKERIDTLTFPLENWLREEGRGDYWRHGSVVHTADALSVPILSVGGWSDRYSNSVMSLVDARPDLVWGVVGPWGHHYPDHGSPGPAIGFQKLALEWWDHWLKSDQPDTPEWPRLRVWMREFDTPGDSLAQRSGAWVQSGPASQESETQDWDLSTLKSNDGPLPWRLPADPTVGQTAGDTGYFGRPGGLPLDQTADDDRSLVFETAPLARDVIIYGSVTLTLRGESGDKPGQIIARLSDVAPDGVAARVSYGVRNLSLDENLDRTPSAAKTGEFYGKILLHSTAYRVRKGHTLRLALSSSFWPLIHAKSPVWDMQINHATLRLHVLPHELEDLSKPLPPAQDLPVQKRHSTYAPDPLSRWTQTTGDRIEMGWHQPLLKTTFAQIETAFSYETSMTHSLDTADGVEQQISVCHRMFFERPDGTAEVSVALTARTTGDRTTADAELNATWNNQPFATRQWRI